MKASAIKVFVSYSHKDLEHAQALQEHLALLKRQGVISMWTDRVITAGTEWANAIDENLEAAQIILLLVSSAFLSSEYCYDIELKRAMQRHESKTARVIPVILRPVDWGGAIFSKLQALPDGGKAITSWPNKDEALASVAKGIRLVAQEMAQNPTPPL